jgi:hypothetical protein
MQTVRAYLTPQNIAALLVLAVIAVFIITGQPVPTELGQLLLALLGLGAGLFIHAHRKE